MFEQATTNDPRSAYFDWALRAGIGLAFVVFGYYKFPSQPGSEWVKLFADIGAGQWFRYFTGVVEILGGMLVWIPRTAMAGLVLLAATMASAAFILIFVLGRPVHSIVSIAFCVALSLFWLSRR
jgi:putative oxidoreductase